MSERSIQSWQRSRGLKRRPLLRASSPLKPKINRELTSKVVQQTGARHKDIWVTISWQKKPELGSLRNNMNWGNITPNLLFAE